MSIAAIVTTIIALIAGTVTAQARPHDFKNFMHAQYVCNNGANGTKKRACEWMRKNIPYGETELRRYINDDCLETIIHWETGQTWDHTIWNGRGSGAYGLPQALPAKKMRSAGADYMTNPITQIKWMRSYVNSRYGSSCGALAFRSRNGWY